MKFLQILSAGLVISGAVLASDWKLERSLVFTDEAVELQSPGFVGAEVALEFRILTRSGWQESVSKKTRVENGRLLFQPSIEGIYALRLPGKELRFLAMSPPPSWDSAAAESVLPRQGEKLVMGKPFTVLCMGDSVTETGDYPEMLAMLLRRSCKNPEIRAVKKAYAGRSVDASVRRWLFDTAEIHPDLGLIMYGLNDQAANVPLSAYLEQYSWLAGKLAKQFEADTLFLQPTPKIDFVNESPDNPVPASSLFQMLTFGAALEIAGRDSGVPVVSTFDAIWGAGGGDLKQAARQMQPLFPPNYQSQLQTMLESPGGGDGIHPNALGHLQIARAVFEKMQGKAAAKKWKWAGATSWDENRLKSRLRAENVSGDRIRGVLEIFPFAGKEVSEKFDYSLEPGQAKEIEFVWPEVEGPEDLGKDPALTAFRFPGPFLQIVDTGAAGSRVQAVAVPWDPPVFFPPQRLIVDGNTAQIVLQTGEETKEVEVLIPQGSEVGRIPLHKNGAAEKRMPPPAELVYTRFAAARLFEPQLDGELTEWKDSVWSPLGEKVQARGNYGPEDHREKQEECFLHFTFAAGSEGIVLAFRGAGEIEKDSATLYFDARSPEELGTAGPYTWADLSFSEDGAIRVSAGDSSPVKEGVKGFWKKTGNSFSGEMFVPYGILGTDAWPVSGDLGVSLIWRHVQPAGKPTTLMWAENGHPWNPRWFGVVRLNAEGPLPYRVRVE